MSSKFSLMPTADELRDISYKLKSDFVVSYARDLWCESVGNGGYDALAAKAAGNAQIMAERADIAMMGRWEPEGRRVCVALAECLAALACKPGGVTFMGQHLDFGMPTEENAKRYRTLCLPVG